MTVATVDERTHKIPGDFIEMIDREHYEDMRNLTAVVHTVIRDHKKRRITFEIRP